MVPFSREKAVAGPRELWYGEDRKPSFSPPSGQRKRGQLQRKGDPTMKPLTFFARLLAPAALAVCFALPALGAEDTVPLDAAHFPDPNFRICLSGFDTDGDGALSPAERDGVTSLQLSEGSMTDLTGLEHFPNLAHLDCSYNQLTALDLSGCPGLETLNCSGNRLTALELSGLSGLKTLYCFGNPLTELDLTGCPALEVVSCSDCRLSSLKVTGCSGLLYLDCGYNPLASLDLSGCSALSELSCPGSQLEVLDLSGAPALALLTCEENRLTRLDLSPCPGLTALYAGRNRLEDLELGTCAALETLWCEGNGLAELELSGCPELKVLHCEGNRLEALDLSACPQLTSLWCGENRLAWLDLTACTHLTWASLNGPVPQSPQTQVPGDPAGGWSLDLSAQVKDWDRVSGLQVTGGTLAPDGRTLAWTQETQAPVVCYSYRTGYGEEALAVSLTLTPAGEPVPAPEATMAPEVTTAPTVDKEKSSSFPWAMALGGAGVVLVTGVVLVVRRSRS